jgi:cephalosporin hydroxylase
VPVGSYVVVEETIVNGHPVWPGFGPGPFEAAKRILAVHGNFAADPKMEKFALTFNPGGFLKRLR